MAKVRCVVVTVPCVLLSAGCAFAQAPAAPQLWTFPGMYGVGLADNGGAVLRDSGQLGSVNRWSFTTGLHALDNRPNDPQQLSGDGSTLIGFYGFSRIEYTINDGVPIVYNHPSSINGGPRVAATSYDGATSIITSSSSGGYLYLRGGTMSPIVVTDPGNVVRNTDSADVLSRSGRYICGSYNPPGQSYLYRLDRLTNTTVTLPLPPVSPGGGEMRAISDDGGVIFVAPGSAGSASSAHAFRWTQAAGYQSLPFITYSGAETAMWPNTHERYSPTDCTADGTIMVGNVAQGPSFIWDNAGGMRVLQTELSSVYGLNLSALRLSGGVSISADGHWLMGSYDPAGGGQTGAWIAYIPSPGAYALLGVGAAGFLRRRRPN